MTTKVAFDIFYPETDGMPLPDGEFQAPIYIRIVGTLRVHFAGVAGTRVNGDTFIYFIKGSPRRSISPDCYVVRNLTPEAEESIERNNVYLLWEVGKAPDFILEIGSKSTASADMGRKRDRYAELGVTEYWRYDATSGDFYGAPLIGERLVDGQYIPMTLSHESDGMVRGRSDALNLDLCWDDGELRFWDPEARRWLLSHEESEAARIAAENRLAELEAQFRRIGENGSSNGHS